MLANRENDPGGLKKSEKPEGYDISWDEIWSKIPLRRVTKDFVGYDDGSSFGPGKDLLVAQLQKVSLVEFKIFGRPQMRKNAAELAVRFTNIENVIAMREKIQLQAARACAGEAHMNDGKWPFRHFRAAPMPTIRKGNLAVSLPGQLGCINLGNAQL